MLGGKERERTSLLIGIPADNNIDVCLVAVTHPVRQSDTPLPLFPYLVTITLAGSADAFTRLKLRVACRRCVSVRVMLVCAMIMLVRVNVIHKKQSLT